MGFFARAVEQYRQIKAGLRNRFDQFIKQTAVNPSSAANMVEAVYKLANGVAGATAYQKLCDQLKKEGGWEVLCRANDQEQTQQYGYKAIAFINRQTQQVRIATAGTKPTEKYDLWDNFKLIAGTVPILKRFISCVPNKLQPAKLFLSNTLEKVKQEAGAAAAKYTFDTCGHSLGAIMSDLTAAEILSRGLQFGRSTTFENPGSRAVVERAIADHVLSGAVTPGIEQLAKKCVEYNAKRNFINNFKPRLAKTTNLVVFKQPEGVEPAPPLPVATVSAVSNIGWDFCNYMGTAVQLGVKLSADQLGLTAIIDQLLNQLDDHKLHNFSALNENNCYRVNSCWNDKSRPLQCADLPGTKVAHAVEVEEREVDGDFVDYQVLLPKQPTEQPFNSLVAPAMPYKTFAHLASNCASMIAWESESQAVQSGQPMHCGMAALASMPPAMSRSLIIC